MFTSGYVNTETILHFFSNIHSEKKFLLGKKTKVAKNISCVLAVFNIFAFDKRLGKRLTLAGTVQLNNKRKQAELVQLT